MVSIITVNYNGLDDTCEMIDSFLLNETYPFEIIVVDNGSQPSQAEKFRQYYAIDPQVKVVQNINNGFAGGNNAGLNVASGDYLFFINNDTYITQPILEALVRRLGDKQNGGVSPMLKYHQCTNTIQFAGFTPLTPITLRNHMIGEREPDNGQYSTPHETAYLHGAAMMIRRDVLQRVGPMSEVFFLFLRRNGLVCTDTTGRIPALVRTRLCDLPQREHDGAKRYAAERVLYVTCAHAVRTKKPVGNKPNSLLSLYRADCHT